MSQSNYVKYRTDFASLYRIRRSSVANLYASAFIKNHMPTFIYAIETRFFWQVFWTILKIRNISVSGRKPTSNRKICHLIHRNQLRLKFFLSSYELECEKQSERIIDYFIFKKKILLCNYTWSFNLIFL